MESSVRTNVKLISLSDSSVLKSSPQPNTLHDTWLRNMSTNASFRPPQLTKQKTRRKPNSLLGRKLQPLSKDNSSSQLAGSVSCDSYSVIPQISSPTVQSHQSPIAAVTGSTGAALQPQSDCIRIYLCYDHEDTKAECEFLKATAEPLLRQFCAQLNLTFQLIDVNWRQVQQPTDSRSLLTFRQSVISDCQQHSIGPDFVLLLADKCGQLMIPHELNEKQFQGFQRVAKENSLPDADVLLSYSKDSESPSARYQLQNNSDAETLHRIGQLFTLAKPFLIESTADKDIASLYRTAIEEEVTLNILQRKDARYHCLAYRCTTPTTADPASVVPEVSDVVSGNHAVTGEGGAQALWESVEHYLGKNNVKTYVRRLQNAAADSTPAADDAAAAAASENGIEQDYLDKIAADFVNDVQTAVLRQLAKTKQLGQTAVVREAQHHALLQAKRLRYSAGRKNNSVRVALLKIVRSFVKDPKRNGKPFVIHGTSGSGKSTAVAEIAAAINEWFPSSGAVVVQRFLGTSTESCDVRSCLAGIAAQIRLAYGIRALQSSRSVGGTESSLHGDLKAFRNLLLQVSKQYAHTQPLFILLDGVEHICPRNDALEALWAIGSLPRNVHLFLSTTSQLNAADGVNENGPNILGALLALVTDVSCTFEVPPPLALDGKTALDSAPDEAGDLLQLLQILEEEYGLNAVMFFTAYMSVCHVGITLTELCDLLSTHPDIVAELDLPPGISRLPVALVLEIRHRLSDYVEDRLVENLHGFGWRRTLHRSVAAKRYNFIVNDDGATVAEMTSEKTNFTLGLHERIVNVHLETKEQTSVFSEDFTSTGDDRSTLTQIDPGNPLTLGRLPHHMKILLPVEGLERCARVLLFNMSYLSARLAAVSYHVVMSDIFQFLKLVQDMKRLSIVEDSPADLSILFRFLTMAKRSLVADSRNLAVEVVTRLSTMQLESVKIAELVKQAEHWLADVTDFATFKPLWPVWPQPNGLLQFFMDGPSHALGLVDGDELVVGYGRKDGGISTWQLDSGSLVHHFDLRPEQPISGIVPAHHSTFVLVSYFSHIDRSTELNVFSTETGIQLLNMTFSQEFEAICLSDDDQHVAISAVVPVVNPDRGGTAVKERLIIGIRVLTKEVEFRLPVSVIHSDGIEKLFFVRNIRRESESLLTLGTRTSRDLAFWDLDNRQLDFVLDLDGSIDLFSLAAEQKMAVCGCAETGTLTVVNLSRGTIQHKVTSESYCEMRDISVLEDSIFVALVSGGVEILSITQNVVTGRLKPDYDIVGAIVPIPTKLATASINEMMVLFVGYSNGDVWMFEVVTDNVSHRLPGHRSKINSLIVNRTRGQLISSSDDGQMIVWNYNVCFDLNEDNTVSSTKESNAVDKTDTSVVKSPPSGIRPKLENVVDVNCFAFSSDEERLFSGSRDGLLQIWETKTGNLVQHLRSEGNLSIDALYLMLSDRVVVTHCSPVADSSAGVKTLQLWDLSKGNDGELVKLQDSEFHVFCSKALPSNDRVLTVGPGVENFKSGLTIAVHSVVQMQTLTAMHCDIYGKMDASNLRIVGFSSARSSRTARGQKSGRKPGIPSATKRLAAGYLNSKPPAAATPSTPTAGDGFTDGKLNVLVDYFPQPGLSYFFTFSLSGSTSELSMERTDPMQFDTTNPECCVLLPSGNACICGTSTGCLTQWNIRSRKTEAEFIDPAAKQRVTSSKAGGTVGNDLVRVAHGAPVTYVTFSKTKMLLISGDEDGKVKLWSIAPTKLLTILSGHSGKITCLLVPAPQFIITSAADGKLCVWEHRIVTAGSAASSSSASGTASSSSSSATLSVRERSTFYLHGRGSSVAMTTDMQRLAAVVATEPVGRSVLFLLQSVNL